MIFPSAFDEAGLLMLQSIHNIFFQIGLSMHSVTNFLVHLSDCQKLRKHLSKPKFICPCIVAYQFNNFPNDLHDINAHVLVATGLKTELIDGKPEIFVQCKNSYRDDASEPGL